MKNKTDEFIRFDKTLRGLTSLSHKEIQERLDAEKAEKKRKNSKKPSSSCEANGRAAPQMNRRAAERNVMGGSTIIPWRCGPGAVDHGTRRSEL